MLYVAYGSNCNIEQMAYMCPHSRRIGVGKLKGWKLVFNVHADIIKTNNKNDVVSVVIWNIADEDWHRLDMYEGFPSYYIKENVNVILDCGIPVKAIVYVMAKNRKGICPPSQGYFDCIVHGVISNGIDVECLYDALEYSFENKTEYNQYKVKGMV